MCQPSTEKEKKEIDRDMEDNKGYSVSNYSF